MGHRMYRNRKFLVTLFGMVLVLNLAVIVRDFTQVILLKPHFSDVPSLIAVWVITLLTLFPIVFLSRLLILVGGSFPDKIISVSGLRWMRVLFVLQLLSFCIDSLSGYFTTVNYEETARENNLPYGLDSLFWCVMILLTAVMNGVVAFLGIGLHKFVRKETREKMLRAFDEP